MRSLIVFVLCFLCFPLSTTGFSIRQKNAFYGGMAIAVGDWSNNKNPGINLGAETYFKINNLYAFGPKVGYCWLTQERPNNNPLNFRASAHYWDITFLQKVFFSLTKKHALFVDFSPGYYFGLFTLRRNNYSHNEFEPDFGLSFGGGFTLNHLLISFNTKVVFTENGSTKWITFSFGWDG